MAPSWLALAVLASIGAMDGSCIQTSPREAFITPIACKQLGRGVAARCSLLQAEQQNGPLRGEEGVWEMMAESARRNSKRKKKGWKRFSEQQDSVASARMGVPSLGHNFSRPSKGRHTHNHAHVLLNKSIMGAQDTSELCAWIEKRHTDFNVVNAFTAYRQLLRRSTSQQQQRHKLVGGRSVHVSAPEMALKMVEAQVMRHMSAAGARECRN